MPKRRQDRTLLKSVCADHVKDGRYELSEPYDFNEWHQLILTNQANDRQVDETDLRFIIHFIDMVMTGKQPKKEVMQGIALAFLHVLNNPEHRWEDAFLLPWSEISIPYSRAELLDLELWGEVTTILEDSPNVGVIEAIRLAGQKWNTSFEKARAAYYKYKK